MQPVLKSVVVGLVVGVVGVVGCSRGDPASAVNGPGKAAAAAMPVRQLGAELGQIVASATPRSLWSWCDHAGVIALRARGASGAVIGTCAQRAAFTFTARAATGGVVVELRRVGSDALVAQVQAAAELTLGGERPAAAQAQARLRLAAADRPAVELDQQQLEALLGRHPRRGTDLVAALAAAKVPWREQRLVARSGDGSTLEVPGQWLAAPRHEVRLRYNRRGQLKLTHWVDQVEREQARDVTSIVLSSRR